MAKEITDEERKEAYALLCTAFGRVAQRATAENDLREAPPSYNEFTEDLLVADSYVEVIRLARGE